MAWIDEADWPEAWTGIYFSPIVKSGSEYIVYATGYGVLKLYKYNLTTQTWTYLNTTPVQPYRTLSMSPDGTKLAAHAVNGKILYIYDITGNSWTTSATAPNFITGEAPEMWSTVWTDDDTVWCHFRAAAGGMRNKCYKYVVSTDTWTQYTNAYLNSTYNASNNMSVNSAGTALFVGGVYPPVLNERHKGFKYVIATDTYSLIQLLGHGTGGYDWLINSDRSAKLWYIDALTPLPLEIFYYDCDTEYEGATAYIFPGDSERDVGYQNLPCGVYEVNYIIAWNRTTEPKNRSYFIPWLPTVTTNPATGIS